MNVPKGIESQPDLKLGPLELLIDVPFYVGCFDEITNPNGVQITETPELVTPTWCIAKCITADSTKRYSSKFFV